VDPPDGGTVNIQLLMPDSNGGTFDSDPDPESYDIHAGPGWLWNHPTLIQEALFSGEIYTV
jgi:hypothetical protein